MISHSKDCAEALIVPVFEGAEDRLDFTGKEGEILVEYPKDCKRRVLLGIGLKEKCTLESLRRSYAAAMKWANGKKLKKIAVSLPKIKSAVGAIEGLLLANYHFSELKSEAASLVKDINLIDADKSLLEEAKRLVHVQEAVFLARDLVNRNADHKTPAYLVKMAKSMGVRTKILDRKALTKAGLGLFLAVARGASVEPYLIAMQYRGAPKSKDHTVVVGKGITYDTGGLNLKPTGSMETMKCDMSGAAAGFGLIAALKKLKVKRNVTVVIATCENAIGSRSYKPGDVYKSYLGKMVEVDNTDAEGRLTLADAIAWANDTLKPTRIIDLATLTGAIVVTFGDEVSGLMSNDEQLQKALQAAGERTHERLWPLPLYEEYRDLLKSDIADLKNAGDRGAGSIKGGLFIQEFVGKTPWAHLDIAGTAFLSKDRRWSPKGGTGVGVRLLLDFLENS